MELLFQECNLQENGWNWLKNRLKQLSRMEGYPKDKIVLKARLERAITEFDKNKDWFKNAFDGLPNRYREMIKVKGDVLKKYRYRY